MTLLRDKKRTIQFEAFHVFKVFVANPKKTDPVLDILVRNKDKLVVFLNNFHNDKGAYRTVRCKTRTPAHAQALPDAHAPGTTPGHHTASCQCA